MAVTWAAAAPHADAIKVVQQAGIGSGYGASGASVFEVLKWPGNKRAILTKLTATGTYTTGGDAITPATFGLAEVHAAFIVDSAGTNVQPSINSGAAQGTPVINVATPGTPKVQYFDIGVETAAGGTLTADVFHVILVGI